MSPIKTVITEHDVGIIFVYDERLTQNLEADAREHRMENGGRHSIII